MEVSNNIRSIRETKGLTQVDMANRMGTERSNYARLENRDVNLTLKQIQEIADALEVSIYEIIGMPQTSELVEEHNRVIQQLEDRLEMTEELLRDKKKSIKQYKSLIDWIRRKFTSEFFHLSWETARTLNLIDPENTFPIGYDLDEDYELSVFRLAESDFKIIGDYMFSNESPNYPLIDFIATSGFIKDKWFIDAYKRKTRHDRVQVVYSEGKSWMGSIIEFLDLE